MEQLIDFKEKNTCGVEEAVVGGVGGKGGGGLGGGGGDELLVDFEGVGETESDDRGGAREGNGAHGTMIDLEGGEGKSEVQEEGVGGEGGGGEGKGVGEEPVVGEMGEEKSGTNDIAPDADVRVNAGIDVDVNVQVPVTDPATPAHPILTTGTTTIASPPTHSISITDVAEVEREAGVEAGGDGEGGDK